MQNNYYFLSYFHSTCLVLLYNLWCFPHSSRSIYIYIKYKKGVDVVEWSRALDVRLSEWCCSVTMVWVQIPSREEQKIDSSKI